MRLVIRSLSLSAAVLLFAFAGCASCQTCQAQSPQALQAPPTPSAQAPAPPLVPGTYAAPQDPGPYASAQAVAATAAPAQAVAAVAAPVALVPVAAVPVAAVGRRPLGLSRRVMGAGYYLATGRLPGTPPALAMQMPAAPVLTAVTQSSYVAVPAGPAVQPYAVVPVVYMVAAPAAAVQPAGFGFSPLSSALGPQAGQFLRFGP